MPLVYQQNINDVTRLAVWHITEEESFFLRQVPLQSKITHPHKRLQHLAGRLLLAKLFPDFPTALIEIADTRKPFLPGDPFHFSISHCEDYAAAIVSRGQRVGVDIEIPRHKINVLKNKFLFPAEQAIALNMHCSVEVALTICWSVKEAIFKWYGAGGVDFKQHIQIESCKCLDGHFEVTCIFTKENARMLTVHGHLFKGSCLTWLYT